MANTRDLKLDKFGISQYRYRELMNFCLQYPDWKKELGSCYVVEASRIDGMPKGTDISDPTFKKANRAINISSKMKTIEQSCIEAGEELYPWLLRSVTEGVSWDLLMPPCAEITFRRMKHKFFRILNERRC